MYATVRRRAFELKAFLFFEGVTLLLGMLGGFLGGTSAFETLRKPPLTPPAIVFPIVWTILYLLMGFAAYLVWNTDDIDRAPPLRMYFLQLVVNVLWPVIFFRLQWRLFAFFWLVLLFGLVSLTATGFRYIHRTAGRLMIPYQLWLLFAGYLNIGVYLLNRG